MSKAEDGEVTPQFKHAKKLAEKARKLRKEKDKTVPVKEYIETVYDSRGHPKKRLVKVMANGMKYRTYVPRDAQ